MQFSVRYYETQNGTKPVYIFLEELRVSDPVLHKLLVAGLKKLRDGQRHGPPLTEKVDERNALFEVRVGRKDIARAFFFFRRGQEIVVTNGYVKKTQNVDRKELKRALQYKKDWERRFP